MLDECRNGSTQHYQNNKFSSKERGQNLSFAIILHSPPYTREVCEIEIEDLQSALCVDQAGKKKHGFNTSILEGFCRSLLVVNFQTLVLCQVGQLPRLQMQGLSALNLMRHL